MAAPWQQYVFQEKQYELDARDRRCAAALGCRSIEDALRLFSRSEHKIVDFFGESKRCRKCPPNRCTHSHSHFHGTDDTRRRVHTTLVWKIYFGPKFPVTDAFDSKTWKCLDGCEFGIGPSGHRRHRGRNPCINPHHYTLMRTIQDNERLKSGFNQLLFDTGLGRMPELQRFSSDAYDIKDILDTLWAIFATRPVEFERQPVHSLGELPQLGRLPSLPYLEPTSEKEFPDLSSFVYETLQIDDMLSNEAMDEDDEALPVPSADLLSCLDDLGPYAVSSPPTAIPEFQSHGPSAGFLIDPYDTINDILNEPLAPLDITPTPNTMINYVRCSNQHCFRHLVVACLQPGQNTSCSTCGYALESASLSRNSMGQNVLTGITHKADYAYAVPRSDSERKYEEGDVVGWFRTANETGHAYAVSLLTAENHSKAFLAGVISRSAFMVANSDPLGETLCKSTDIVCMLGFVKVHVEGPVEVGNSLFTNPQSSMAGVAIASDLDRAVPEGSFRLGVVLEILDDEVTSGYGSAMSSRPASRHASTSREKVITTVKAFVSPLCSFQTTGSVSALRDLIKKDVMSQLSTLREEVDQHDRQLSLHERRILELEARFNQVSMNPRGRRGKLRRSTHFEVDIPDSIVEDELEHGIQQNNLGDKISLYHPLSSRFVSFVNRRGRWRVVMAKRMGSHAFLRPVVLGNGNRVRFVPFIKPSTDQDEGETFVDTAGLPFLGIGQGGKARQVTEHPKGTFKIDYRPYDQTYILTRVRTTALLAYNEKGEAMRCTDNHDSACHFVIQQHGSIEDELDDMKDEDPEIIKEVSNKNGRIGMISILFPDFDQPVIVAGGIIARRITDQIKGPEFSVDYISNENARSLIYFSTFCLPRQASSVYVLEQGSKDTWIRLANASVVPMPNQLRKQMAANKS